MSYGCTGDRMGDRVSAPFHRVGVWFTLILRSYFT